MVGFHPPSVVRQEERTLQVIQPPKFQKLCLRERLLKWTGQTEQEQNVIHLLNYLVQACKRGMNDSLGNILNIGAFIDAVIDLSVSRDYSQHSHYRLCTVRPVRSG